MWTIEDNPQGITEADIVVGIPSYNEAESIAFPTQQVDKGLSGYFGDRSAVIVNCDNHSEDGTREAFMNTPTETPKIYLSTAEGVKGKGNNFRNLFAKAVELSAKAVVAVDADLKSITPQWIRNLGEPLFEDYEYVAPLYVRHKNDGAINNSIAYPITRALYGRRVRQPVGGDFGFSGELARVFAEGEAWTDSASNYGVDIWMTTLTLRRRVPVIQSFMGSPKLHESRHPLTGDTVLFDSLITTLFDLVKHNADFWKEVKWSRPTAVYGLGQGEFQVPPAVDVDERLLRRQFEEGMETHADVFKECLPPAVCDKLCEVADSGEYTFEFPTNLWAKALYDYCKAYRDEVVPHDRLRASLRTLFFGKTLSFLRETEAMNNQQVEELIEDQCLQFEKTKPYLLERWFGS